MHKVSVRNLFVICGSIIILILPCLSFTASADTSAYDPTTDGLVTNFENYQYFGGKTATAVKSISYNVFLPTGMGFDLSNDTLEMKVGMPDGTNFIAYESNLPSAAGTCKSASNGYNCTATWNFTASWPQLTQGTYTISFVALDHNLQHLNGIYMDLFNGTGAKPMYAEWAQVFINEPLTTPYAGFVTGVQSLYSLVDPSSPTSITFTAEINAQNLPTEVDFYLDGNLMQSVTEYTVISNSSFTGGQVDQFQYILNNLSALSNGNHILTATAVGSGYSVPVLTQDGQSKVNIEAAYATDQSCKTQVTAINSSTKNVIDQESTELNQIQSLDSQVVTYFAKKAPSVTNYSQLVNAVNNDNKDVYTNLAVLVKDNSFQCAEITNQISRFIADLDKVYAALNTYQSDSVSLINQAGGLSG